VIGGGAHEPVVAASRQLLLQLEANLDLFEATDELATPGTDVTRFLVLTYDGVLAGSGPTAQLASGQDPLSPVFEAGNELVTQLRLATERPSG
jgi:hypothetical protein